MTEPRRLLDELSQLSEDELRVLSREAQIEPPSGLRSEIWTSLAARLPLDGGSSPGGTPPAPPAPPAALGKLALLSKATLLVLAIGGAAFLGRSLWRAEPAPVPARLVSLPTPPSQATAATPAPVLPEPPRDVTPPSTTPRKRTHSVASAASVATAPPPPAPSASNTQEESRLITAARSALRAGNSARALSLLSEAQQRFGHGVLGQEREALTIEALAKSGQRASAKSRGEAFLKTYRDSPYAARIRALIDG